MPAAMLTAALSPHPSTTNDIVSRIAARIHWGQTGGLAIAYTLQGDCERIRIPPPRPPQRSDGLWGHTCFEAFVAKPNSTGYIEFNFSPSREWAIYNFTGYREPAPLPEAAAPEITVLRKQTELEVDASIDLPRSPLDKAAPLRIALAAVIEDSAGALSYWALRHPTERPDFHRRENFVLELQSFYEQAGMGK
jgi:hypothetical protein